MIHFQGISKTYDGGKTFVVREFDLEIGKGELLVLLGESGCGKTTSLKMINRLVEPTRGRIFIDGVDIGTINKIGLRRGIGYVFQGVGLFPHMTVDENVATVLKLLGWPKQKIRGRVDELLEMVNLPPDRYRDRRPRQLSGGQRQRVGFARALAAGPKVMLLDEPFGELDPITRDALQAEFIRIHGKLGLTALMVTHDMIEALLLAHRIAIMSAGRILRVGTPHELMADPRDEYVAALMESPKRKADQLEAIARGQTALPQ